ncbi:uncharacterized protein EI90DRAFT_3070499 [Cantharellus anzutake]|uniref:uncharacterized protein n=1 Tax=Cantharellus anzutake TaxID=1750568 RepID=UPI001906DD6A|nr:uncharacterized protein EI90DRAFT_3070499 [Cantharellus anzutake]KAF8326329.1 hypothetical protein EI90DRAFT_3070499 [Cantharellus anzutake]
MQDLLDFVINHVFMPPKLPQEEDDSSERKDFLLSTVYSTMELYRQQYAAIEHQALWGSLLKMVDTLRRINECPEVWISKSIKNMVTGDIISILIRAQNASVIIRCGEEETIFESFEVSPRNKDVMGCTRKLIRSFPGPAIAVQNDIALDPAFLEELSTFLIQMDIDSLADAQTLTRKAGSDLVEERDTTHPMYITELLTGILRGLGQPADILRIQKRTSDDVLWDKTLLPWRRSPLWLVVRVTLQTAIRRNASGANEYKSFMILLLAQILRNGVENRLPGDVLYCMRAKLSRRLFKIRSWAGAALVAYVRGVVVDTERLLQDRWEAVQDVQMQAPEWAPDGLDIDGDTSLTLQNSRSYIDAAFNPVAHDSTSAAFNPSHHPRPVDNPFEDVPHHLPEAVKADGLVALWDFEHCVRNSIDDWVSLQVSRQNCEEACTILSDCMMTYAENANTLYEKAPEQQSIMLLTLFELWMALDILAVTSCPLLKSYSPEIPLTLYETLLLPNSDLLERISRIQKHLRSRYREAGSNPRSIFSEIVDEETFAVKFFSSSPFLQGVKHRIEEQATAKRDEKLLELRLLNHQYEENMALAARIDHNDSTRRGKVGHYPRRCQKCKYEKKARANIHIHEWPLPGHLMRAEVVVFELAGPWDFKTWRRATYWLLRDICTRPVHSHKAAPSMTLRRYADLNISGNIVFDSLLRISLASQKKSFLNTHFKGVEIPASEESICLPNALSYRLYDVDNDSWIYPPSSDCDLSHRTSKQIAHRSPYVSLECFAQGTSHTSNEVLASQHECPASLGLQEFIAFGSLRAGARLQWYNIAREIPSRNLSFHHEVVYDLISRAACQVGCLSSDGDWECHEVLRDASFCDVLLDVLDQLGTDIEGNWNQSVAALTVSTLACRLLASVVHESTINKTYKLLRKIRSIAMRWLDELTKLQSNTETETEQDKYEKEICRIAATCRSTFDVDSIHAGSLLRTSEDVAIFVECAIILHNHSAQGFPSANLHLHQLLLRDQRLSCNMEELLITRAQETETMQGLSEAIARVWTSFDLTCRWTRLPRPNHRWLATVTGQRSQEVQFNVLSGALLIEGKPFGRLPPAMRGHPIYKELFGEKNLSVVPSDMEDMEYATNASVSCGSRLGIQDIPQIIHFGWRDGKLILRSRSCRPDGETCWILELLPREIFMGDLPTILIDDYVHWLEVSTRQIELRPKEAPWTPSQSSWHLRRTRSSAWVMDKQSSIVLVDCRSRTAEMMHDVLRHLEAPNNILVTRPATHQLLVDLPRGGLCSLNFPGFEIDHDNQSTGTMLGLQSQLVLRQSRYHPARFVEPIYSKRVIIPVGDVSIVGDGDYVAVTIDHSGSRRVNYYDYDVDTLLGRLVGDGSLSSTLFQAYLHAITSYCLPDPLTSLSGTEEALQILRSARCRSFLSLNDQERNILHQLSTLTPLRSWYPFHLRVMQQTVWNKSLRPIIQHDAFWSDVQSIIEWDGQMQAFRPSMSREDSASTPHVRDPHLLSRARCRNAIWPGSGQDKLGVDTTYRSRDASDGLDTARIHRTSNVSSLVYKCPLQLRTPKNLLSRIESWTEEMKGSSTSNQSCVSLGYSREWLSLDIASAWISLYNACRSVGWGNDTRFKMAFSLSALEYSNHRFKDLLPVVLAFSRYPEFRSISPPLWPRYKFTMGYVADPSQLNTTISGCANPFQAIGDASALNVSKKKRKMAYHSQVSSQVSFLVTHFTNQWNCAPSSKPTLPFVPSGDTWLINTSLAMHRVTELFGMWSRNRDLCDHIREVQHILDNRYTSNAPTSPHLEEAQPSIVSYRDVFLRRPPILAPMPSPPRSKECLASKSRSGPDNLRILISRFHSSGSPLSRKYGEDLEASRDALQYDTDIGTERVKILRGALYRDYQMYQTYLYDTLEQIERAIDPDPQSEAPEEIMRSTIRSLLHHLSFSSRSRVGLSPGWETALIRLAQSILLLQRSERLMKSRHCTDEFLKEYQNYTDLHDISDRLDWLLIQIDSNFLIRPLQIDVARNMMFPCPQENNILQLNMGEGKSSVIVPLIASSLADGQKLVRIIVLKPLANQMFQLLVRRLSGLANRRVYYTPFSRATSMDGHHLSLFKSIYLECMRAGGILVMQPEHVLSFKLMGVDRQLSAVTGQKTPNAMLGLQRWLDSNVRDILDESDEILAVKYQLVYSVGAQQPLNHHPDRWTVVQHVFSILRSHAWFIEEFLPQGGFEVEQQRGGCFPHFRILTRKAGVWLVGRLVRGIMSGECPDLPSLRLFHGRARQEAVAFITEPSPGELDELRNHCHRDTRLWNTLLLLRGLFAHGILTYILSERRWRVDYGLDLRRSLLAVPYRAKDVPSLRAEFSHPDVCISLTCLSYYYGGLSCDQLDICFELLGRLEDPVVEYGKWVKENCLVPEFLCDYSSFNPGDHSQRINHLYPAFQRNQETINFFLSHVVFPREAKAYPQKLSASGWDIAERRQHVTTGFSGTNDNRYLLPTSIKQVDIPAQLSTNAKVLNLMLQPENDHYRTAERSKFLDLLIEETPQIRVLLDVGAQMLEDSNRGLASRWLSKIPAADVDVAIFFEDDEILAIRRDGETEPFFSSSYRRRLDRCLVYLDDSHTRGTDLMLPLDYRAAVTLGQKVTKDKLVQGCMRMRRLGQGQSIIFLAPPVVDHSIRRFNKKRDGEQITAGDILAWSIGETCKSLQHYSSHWREQGIHYMDRQCAWKEFWLSDASDASGLAKYWLQPESKSLEEMYEVSLSSVSSARESSHHPAADFREIRKRAHIFSFSTEHGLVRMEEDQEQEREVTHELEREQQVERPPPLPPARHRLDPDIVSFVRSGRTPADSSLAFVTLFPSVSILHPSPQQATKWSDKLLATRDFVTVIKGLDVQKSIEFLRPVNWILSSARDPTLVVCSPFEANELLPEIRRSHNTTLHVYSPRVNQPMRSFDDFRFCTIPPLPTMWTEPERLTISQLNIFSGQVYLNDFETYLELCNFLGVNTSHDGNNEIETQSDGFILPQNRTGEMELVCPFDSSPLPFIHELMSHRRKGIPYTSTHLGRIVNGAFVRPEDF